MSKFRNLIETLLLEMSSIRIPKGDYDEFRNDTFVVYKNPTKSDIAVLIDKLPAHSKKTLRGLVLPGDNNFYVWDSYDATHQQVSTQLLEMPMDDYLATDLIMDSINFFIVDNKVGIFSDEPEKGFSQYQLNKFNSAPQITNLFSKEELANPIPVDQYE